ncbi:MAG: DUF305 domain-containing protein [Anaerolineales bacterium]
MRHAKSHAPSHMPMPWNRLLLMAGLHFVLMFILMYAMVDVFANVIPNLNQAYMAALMTAPMLMLEVLLMGSMYADKRALMAILGASVLVFAAAFAFIRLQTGIGDRAFLRSMIPHHGAAILMCEQADLEDPEVVALCERIVASQQEEIDQMKAILARLD